MKSLLLEKKRIEDGQGDSTYTVVVDRLDRLISLKDRIGGIKRNKQELRKLHDALVTTEGFIAGKLRAYLQNVLDALKGSMGDFYDMIQPDGQAPIIRLELAEDAKQPLLHLLVDFKDKEKVVPGGYLSDSQLHTLALSLRLAAIEMANEEVPIIVLDDVVTSYDADHRKAVAALIALKLQKFQIIIVTHDEQFFRYLQDHLPAGSWSFKRIKTLDEDFGPRFHDHKVTAEMIKAKWDAGDYAANEIRQAEEEWLLTKAREFGVSVRIRDVHGAHKYDRGELAQALSDHLKKNGLFVPSVQGIANPFLKSLQNGSLENFGSHFSDDPNAWASIGDEKQRWAEFEEFRGYFVCPDCGHKKFKRPKVGVRKALCDRCETPFAFAAPKDGLSQQSGAGS